jgi:hypothetical protein
MSTANQMWPGQRATRNTHRRHRISRTERCDPRYLEYKQARRFELLNSLKHSYASLDDTLPWAVAVWVLSVVALLPFMRAQGAAVFAVLVAVTWAGVHRARRV